MELFKPYRMVFFGLFLLLFLVSPHYYGKIFSLECKPGFTYETQKELEQIKNLCEQKVADLKNQANTLSSQITFMDTQVYLTTLRIQATEQKITDTQKEIDLLSTRIDNLDSSLNYLSKTLLERIVNGYKTRSLSLFNLFLDSGNADDFFNRVKYQKTTQNNNQNLLLQVQESKLNFEDQKKTREQKKKDLDQFRKNLDSQKIELKNQQEAKRTLLTVTKNNEATYQQLVEKAKQELAGYTAFTSNAGGGLTTFGNGSNGWYYTQRDPRWGNLTIGNSPYLVWQAGCALTSVSMVCKSYGQNVSPAMIALDNSNFVYGDLLNSSFNCGGKSTTWINSSRDSVKSYVQRKIPVILRLVAPSVSGLHFVVAWDWDNGANDAIIHDPYYGPDKKFTERYDWSQITTAIVIN